MARLNSRCALPTERVALSVESIDGGARRMTRRLFSLCLTSALLASLPVSMVRADELPLRKPGLWEMKVVRVGSMIPEMTLQHCTDETTDKEMSTAFAPMTKEVCSKRDVAKTATGYVSDSVCTVGGLSMTSHSDVTGDFDSAFTVKSTSHSEGGPSIVPRDINMTVESKWLGPCKAGQKPGDIVMPGGFKLNVKDADKLKGLLPK
jgi:Protein of unknown function (DUF3617)